MSEPKSSKLNKKSSELRRRITLYNLVPTLFWSVLNFVPVGYFCYVYVDRSFIYVAVAVSILSGFLPQSFFDRTQLGRTTAIYSRIGMRKVRKYTQDGDWVNMLIRKKYPDYRAIKDKNSLKKELSQTYFYEKSHFVMLVFFLSVTIYAFIIGSLFWALIITANNLFFNVYPIWLQQYNRIRIKKLKK